MVVAVAAVAVGAGADAARVIAVFACCPAGGVAIENVETVTVQSPCRAHSLSMRAFVRSACVASQHAQVAGSSSETSEHLQWLETWEIPTKQRRASSLESLKHTISQGE